MTAAMLRFLPCLFLVGCASGDFQAGDTEAESIAAPEDGSDAAVTVTTGVTGHGQGTSGSPESTGGADSEPEPGDGSSSGDDDGSTSNAGHGSTGGGDESTGGLDASTGGSTDTGVEPPPADAVDLSGFVITQTNSSRTFTLPAGTVVPSGGRVVIGRDASRGAFEGHWGVDLGDDVVYVDSEDAFPAINGDETFSLRDADDVMVDGPTAAIDAGQTMQRVALDATALAWEAGGDASATPGDGLPDADGAGVFITEASDASGAGAFVYEFVELQAWPQ
ncbi:MAG: hypothetical protein AAGA54_36910 [Myxococcota bacterium]